jgi:hypothetical protein
MRAQSLLTLRPRIFDPLSAHALVEQIQEEYHFKQAPTPQDIANAAPSNFVFGKVRRGDEEIAVEGMSVTNFGTFATVVAAWTRTSTEDADFFLNSISAWMTRRHQIDLTPTMPTNYFSQLEVVLEKTFHKRLAGLQQFGMAIGSLLRGYGFDKYPDFEPSGFSLNYDGTKPDRYAGAFSLERRAATSYESNKYFTQAPLKTNDHIAILEQIERWL